MISLHFCDTSALGNIYTVSAFYLVHWGCPFHNWCCKNEVSALCYISISTYEQIMIQRKLHVLENQPFLKNLTVLLFHFCYFIINSVPHLAIHLMCFDLLNTHTHTHTHTHVCMRACEIYDGHGTVHKHNFPIIALSFASNFSFTEPKFPVFLYIVPRFNLYGMSGDCII